MGNPGILKKLPDFLRNGKKNPESTKSGDLVEVPEDKTIEALQIAARQEAAEIASFEKFDLSDQNLNFRLAGLKVEIGSNPGEIWVNGKSFEELSDEEKKVAFFGVVKEHSYFRQKTAEAIMKSVDEIARLREENSNLKNENIKFHSEIKKLSGSGDVYLLKDKDLELKKGESYSLHKDRVEARIIGEIEALKDRNSFLEESLKQIIGLSPELSENLQKLLSLKERLKKEESHEGFQNLLKNLKESAVEYFGELSQEKRTEVLRLSSEKNPLQQLSELSEGFLSLEERIESYKERKEKLKERMKEVKLRKSEYLERRGFLEKKVEKLIEKKEKAEKNLEIEKKELENQELALKKRGLKIGEEGEIQRQKKFIEDYIENQIEKYKKLEEEIGGVEKRVDDFKGQINALEHREEIIQKQIGKNSEELEGLLLNLKIYEIIFEEAGNAAK